MSSSRWPSGPASSSIAPKADISCPKKAPVIGRRFSVFLLRLSRRGRCLGDEQDLARIDLIRVLQHGTVGLEDAIVRIRVAKFFLGDRRERVAALNLVSTRLLLALLRTGQAAVIDAVAALADAAGTLALRLVILSGGPLRASSLTTLRQMRANSRSRLRTPDSRV